METLSCWFGMTGTVAFAVAAVLARDIDLFAGAVPGNIISPRIPHLSLSARDAESGRISTFFG